MSDKQKVIVSLTLASQTCTEALKFLIARDQSQANSTDMPEPLPVLHKDLISLLSLIHASTTKLGLALKPSAPNYSASLSPLKDIASHVSGLSRCASLFRSDIHGVTLIQEISSIVKDIIESIRSLVQKFIAIETSEPNGTRDTGKAGDEYMVRTGAVHDLIDKARGENGVSKNNIDAVRKKLEQDRGSLDDGLREVGEMIEQEETSAGEEGNEVIEDGWDELGLGSGQRMNKEELKRTKSVHTILRLTSLLHKRVSLDLLSISSPLALDTFCIQSSALLLASDELISTLYAPQDSSVTANEMTSFLGVIKGLQAGLGDFLSGTQALETQLGEITLSTKPGSGAKIDMQKWFDTCFHQIYKVAGSFVLQNTSEEP